MKYTPNRLWKPAAQCAGLFLCAGLFCVSVMGLPGGQSTLPKRSKNGFRGCGNLQDSTGNPSCLRISFEDEVAGDHLFAREFAGDLEFRLNPEQASGGWFIEVIPKKNRIDKSLDYVWVVTPPYHFGNQQYLDTSYGISAQEAVRNSPREFNFVLDEKQYEEAARLVDLAVSSHPIDVKRTQADWEKEGQDAVAALMSFPVATGRLSILDSRVKDPVSEHELGFIEWIKFKVELRVPCGFPVIRETERIRVDSSACNMHHPTK